MKKWEMENGKWKMGNGKWRMRKWKDERENTKQSGFDLGDWIFFAYFAAY